ncbi:protein of unknown function [Virgibacillus subterraneus]|uniref:DUF4305 domain-containing protein n=2 Tax=Virgibacillus TaxID=84406 RepID=A0A1H1GHR3_9BACI|nr:MULTISPECIES: YdiK family protein [Virgibacillus]SDR12754.1 protein of unknown function [Virgibacillus salinus]SEQ81105.1 protein of unknown function [Virgibacillus subterraneus]
MKISPKAMFVIYFIMGILFTYMAIQSTGESVWNFSTIILAIIATLDFGVGFRMLVIHFRLKKKD